MGAIGPRKERKKETMIKLKLNELEWIDFTPEWNGNKECNLADRVKCKIKYISQADQDKITDSLIGEQRKGFRAQKGMAWSKANHDLVNSHVKDIKNVFIVTEEGEKELTTMKELYKIPALKGLYAEIAEALDAANSLEELEIKN